MKNLLKYSFFFLMSMTIACGNAAPEKVMKTAKATTDTPIKKEEVAKPVMVNDETKATTEQSVDATTTEAEKNTEKSPKVKEETKPKINTKKEPTQMVENVKNEKKGVVEQKPVDTDKPPSTSVEKQVTTTSEVKKEPTENKKDVETAKEVVDVKTSIEPTIVKEETPPSPPPFSHDAWNTLTQKHISATGKVNYKGFKADKAAFEAYLKSLADNPLQSSWSSAKKMAYWINTYNAFTIKLIVDNYPVKSIMDLHGGKPWDRKWIKLGGKTYSLNNIEHDILRPQYKDARIHFAVNCAAKSCPPVWNKAWTDKNLESQLTKATKAFINNTKYNQVGKKEVKISKIFEWYAVDFGDIITYLNKYAASPIDGNTKVNYQEYNWALNE